MFDIITIGGATRDIFFQCYKDGKVLDKDQKELLAFEYGSKIIPDETFFSYGGGAFNTSVNFAKQGLKVSCLCAIGQEGTGDLILQNLTENKVDISLIQRVNETHTGLSVIVSAKKDRVAFLYRGANNFLKMPQPERILQTNWLYITSLNNQATKVLPETIEIIERKNIKLALNPGMSQIKKNDKGFSLAVKRANILILNREEGICLLGEEPEIENRLLVRKLLDIGPQIVVLTDGENGNYVGNHEEFHFAPAIRSIYKESTGAGDAFGATFVANIIKGSNIKLSQQLASINAASVVESLGATQGLLSANEIKRRLVKITVR